MVFHNLSFLFSICIFVIGYCLFSLNLYNAVNIFFTSKNEQDGYVWKIDKTDVRGGIYT